MGREGQCGWRRVDETRERGRARSMRDPMFRTLMSH